MRNKHIDTARKYAEKLWKLGFGVMCPHLNDLGMEYSEIPYEQLMAFDLIQVMYMNSIYMLPGWKRSPGALRELKLAEELNKPVFYKLKEAEEWLRRNTN